jgi:hypothetical protein
LNPYPVTIEARKAKRQEVLDRCLAEARDKAEQSGRSLNCKDRKLRYGADHMPCFGGAQLCLCECHDPVLVPAGELPEA